MPHEYKVNRLVWETFEAVLLAQGKRFVKDMAKTLLVDEKVLLRQVFPTKEAFHVTLLDSEATLCMAVSPVSSVAARCRQPVQTGHAFCLLHLHQRPLLGSDVVPVRRLQDAADRPPLWLLADQQTVIDSEGTVRGSLVNQQLLLITTA